MFCKLEDMRLFINIVIVVFLFNLIACENGAPKVENKIDEKIFDGVWYSIGAKFNSEDENLNEESNQLNKLFDGEESVTNLDDFEGLSFIEIKSNVLASGTFDLSAEKKLIRNYEFNDNIKVEFITSDTLLFKELEKDKEVFFAKVAMSVVTDTLHWKYSFLEESKEINMIMFYKKLPDYIKLVD